VLCWLACERRHPSLKTSLAPSIIRCFKSNVLYYFCRLRQHSWSGTNKNYSTPFSSLVQEKRTITACIIFQASWVLVRRYPDARYQRAVSILMRLAPCDVQKVSYSIRWWIWNEYFPDMWCRYDTIVFSESEKWFCVCAPCTIAPDQSLHLMGFWILTGLELWTSCPSGHHTSPSHKSHGTGIIITRNNTGRTKILFGHFQCLHLG
jgi:hypothetical protein